MAPAIRLIVFDLDGTLIDSTQDIASAVNATLRRLAPGRAPLPMETVRSFIGDGVRELIARSLAEAGVSTPLDDAQAVFLRCYRDCMLETTRLHQGVAPALARLASRTLSVLSNKPGELSREILAALGVAGRFARIYGGGDVPGRKPDPGGLLRLMEEAGARRRETLMVGDSPVDVRTGKAAGVGTAGVTYGLDPAGVAAEGPDMLFESLEGLADRLQGRDL
jgi:phosphoglycolate phosphatase